MSSFEGGSYKWIRGKNRSLEPVVVTEIPSCPLVIVAWFGTNQCSGSGGGPEGQLKTGNKHNFKYKSKERRKSIDLFNFRQLRHENN